MRSSGPAGSSSILAPCVTTRPEGSSAASGINDDGTVVGWAENSQRQRRAFVYEDGEMQDLNDLLYLVTDEGFAINPSIVSDRGARHQRRWDDRRLGHRWDVIERYDAWVPAYAGLGGSGRSDHRR